MDRPSKPVDPGITLLNALLNSVSRNRRETLRSRIVLARNARNDAADSVFFDERGKAGRDHLIPRSGMHRVYDVSMVEAEKAADAIMVAAIEAGAKDGPLVEYVIHDYNQSVHARMMSGFGHGHGWAHRRREIQSLDQNASVKSALARHRVKILRDDYERNRPTAFDRYERSLKSNRPVAVAMLAFAVWGAVNAPDAVRWGSLGRY